MNGSVFCLTAAIAAGAIAVASTGPRAAPPASHAQAKWIAVETTEFAWRKGAAPYTFVIEGSSEGVGPGTETIPRLRIAPPSGPVTIVPFDDGFTSVNEDYPNLKPLFRDNLLRSKYLYLSPRLKGADDAPLLIAFGNAMASDQGVVRIFLLDANGVPVTVFTEEFAITDIKDLDGDGKAELAGYRTLPQTFNDCVETYDPASVFRFVPKARVKFVYDQALSKRYTESRGLQWAGPEYREDIGVSICGATKGRIAKVPPSLVNLTEGTSMGRKGLIFGLMVALTAALAIPDAIGAAPAAAPAPANPPASKWVATETTHYVWRKGASAYKFVIEEDRGNLGSGDETSPRLKIVGPGGKTVTVAAELGWTTLTDDESLAPLVRDNLVRSKYVYVTRKLMNAQGEPALILFGSPMGDDPGAIRVIMLDSTGAPRVVLTEEAFDLSEIKDLNGDGVPEVAGHRSYSQMFNDCVKTYDPAQVFRFATAARDKLVYDEVLTRAYMKAGGVEWAGPKVREDIGVSVCGNNKGRVVPKPATQ